MTEVFADTFDFIAILGPDGEERRRALNISTQRPGIMVTTAWVLTEVANFLRRAHEREAYVELVRSLEASSDVLLMPATDGLWRRGIDLFSKRLDKEWSLTDCISFVVMTERGITDALTGDHHFEQAGFAALLK